MGVCLRGLYGLDGNEYLAFSSTLRIFWYPGRRSAMRIFLLGLYVPDHAVSPTIWPSEFLVGG